MNPLREAAQQALEALETLIPTKGPSIYNSARDALRAALAQQNDPTDPGNDVDALREHVRHLERRIRELHAQQAEPLNLSDPAVQKRLASQWGYVPAAQAEPVEQVAYIHRQGNYWDTSERHLTDDEKARGWTEEPLYLAPPQRKPLTEEEKRALADKFLSCQPESYEVSGVFNLISAVERAHGIKE